MTNKKVTVTQEVQIQWYAYSPGMANSSCMTGDFKRSCKTNKLIIICSCMADSLYWEKLSRHWQGNGGFPKGGGAY